MFDRDTIIKMNAEHRQQLQEERKEKNRILRMSNTKKKQIAWNNLYPKLEASNIPW